MLMPYLKRDALLVCGLIRGEVLRGIRDVRQQANMAEFFTLAVNIQLDDVVWDGAWKLGWSLDRRGNVLPFTDLCIAHMAIMHHATLITRDRHFAGIAGLKMMKSLPEETHG
jgi:predicted nucleic acid-binding protein